MFTPPRSSSLDGWSSLFIFTLLGGLIGWSFDATPRSPQPQPAQIQPPSAPQPIASSFVGPPQPLPVYANARQWEDPLAAAASAAASFNADEVHQVVDRPPVAKLDTLAIFVPLPENDSPEGTESRMATRQAVAAALHRLRFAPVRQQTVGWIMSPQPNPQTARRLSTVLAYEYWRPDPVRDVPGPLAQKQILVLYHGDSILRKKEYSAISQIKELRELVQAQLSHDPSKAAANAPKENSTVHAIVLRTSSDDLRQDALELVRSDNTPADIARPDKTLSNTPDSPAPRYVIVNTGSTANLPTLFASALSGNPSADLVQFCDGKSHVLQSSDNRCSLFRVLDDDNRLFRLLIDELLLRGIDPRDSKNAIVILHERDSAFGRALPISLAKELSTDNVRTVQLPAHFFPIAFQSSIDADPLSSRPITARSLSGDSSSSAGVQPLGTRQLDHVFRALSQVAETVASNHEQRLRAVFLSSTDRLDLRPIIQMIRTRFPGVLILTTDLYGHYADPDDFPVMRNLLVASHLGLSCGPALQGDVPPFRSAYGTSTFLGVLRGIAEYMIIQDGHYLEHISGTLSQDPIAQSHISEILTGSVRPSGRVYEITARGAHMLATGSPHAGRRDRLLYAEPQVSPFIRFCVDRIGKLCFLLTIALSAWLAFRAWCLTHNTTIPPTHPLGRGEWLPLLIIAVLPILFSFSIVYLFESTANPVSTTYAIVLLISMPICAILTFVVWTHFYREGSTIDQAVGQWRSLTQAGCLCLACVWASIALTLLVVAFSVDTHGVVGGHALSPGEHFALMDGASAWSSQFIRIGAIGLSIAFIVWQLRDLPTADRRLPRMRQRAGWYQFWRRSWRQAWRNAWKSYSLLNWEPPLVQYVNRIDGGKLDRQLVRRLQPHSRLIRVSIFTVLFMVPVLVLVLRNDPALTNVRGVAARYVDAAIAVLLAAGINVAVFLVWDEARVLTRYASNLASQRRRTRWPSSELTHYRARYGFARDLLPSLIDVDRLAHLSASTNKTIYWPVAIIILASLALHPRFDNWPSSWSSYLLFGVSLLFAVYAGVKLRHACESLRDVELEHLAQVQRQAANLINQADQLIAQIKGLQIGAFAAWRDQPMIRAFALPIIGFVAIRVMNWIGGVVATF